MSNSCKWFREYDDDAGDYEYCAGAEKRASCSGSLCACRFPQFFNVPKHRLSLVRANFKGEQSDMRAQAVAECGVRA